MAGSGWVAGHPAITVPGAACCWYTSNPLPDGLTSSPAVPSVGLPPLAVTVRVNVPVCTAPSASVAVTFQYAPNGKGTGLCVSDPRGGWASDPLPDGLILAWCNSGNFQQFIPQSNGTLKNVATNLYVNPDGKGAQLRGGMTPPTWGGSVYTWTEYDSLPA